MCSTHTISTSLYLLHVLRMFTKGGPSSLLRYLVKVPHILDPCCHALSNTLDIKLNNCSQVSLSVGSASTNWNNPRSKHWGKCVYTKHIETFFHVIIPSATEQNNYLHSIDFLIDTGEVERHSVLQKLPKIGKTLGLISNITNTTHCNLLDTKRNPEMT